MKGGDREGVKCLEEGKDIREGVGNGWSVRREAPEKGDTRRVKGGGEEKGTK